jgi:hypothetical protein
MVALVSQAVETRATMQLHQDKGVREKYTEQGFAKLGFVPSQRPNF